MNSVVGVVCAGALLLVLAGAQKVTDPWPAASALRQTGLPASRSLVRFGAGIEIAVGSAFLVVGTTALSLAVAVLYLGFAAFVLAALRSGVDGSCGCFGREDTPPSWLHVMANISIAIVSIVYASGDAAAPIDLVATWSFDSLTLAASTLVLAAILVAVYSVVPRTLAAVRLHTG